VRLEGLKHRGCAVSLGAKLACSALDVWFSTATVRSSFRDSGREMDMFEGLDDVPGLSTLLITNFDPAKNI